MPPILQPFANNVEAIQLDEDVSMEPIGILAQEIQLLDIHKEHKILEFGAGTGYALAVMGQLCRRVFGVERVRSYAHEAGRKLQDLRIFRSNIIHGHTAHVITNIAPFDRILLSCAVDEHNPIIQELIASLAEEGFMIAPLINSQNEQIGRAHV